jgi:hypothetical protein
MARNKSFHPGREPFRSSSDAKRDLRLRTSHIHGPFSFLNPTRAQFTHQLSPPVSPNDDRDYTRNSEPGDAPPTDTTASGVANDNVKFLWRSRDNRKGRHALLVDPTSQSDTKGSHVSAPRKTSHPREILKNVSRMVTCYPVWDISWCVAYIFTWGSVIWCINGFFSFLPLVRPSTEFSGETVYGGGITAFVGAVIFFEFGSVLLLVEAVNANSEGCFGWAVEELVSGNDGGEEGEGEKGVGGYKFVPDKKLCVHHHQNRRNFVGKGSVKAVDEAKKADKKTKDGKTWQWFPSRQALKEHYFHELGFLASFSQFCGATVFSIAGITALPGINNHISQGLLDGIYWVPQVVGGSGFIVSGTLYLLETQKNWYTPSLRVLGWHIAFWNLIGGIGFTLCGALGMAYKSSGAEYQASLATFWGSFVSSYSLGHLGG